MSDSNIFDYSTILSVNSSQYENFANNECDQTTNKTNHLINLENVNSNLVNNLNKEFTDIGYESIYTLRQIDYNVLFKNSFDLIQRYRRQLITIERIQDQNHKLDKENEFFLKRQQTLKENLDSSARNLMLNEEKFRQLQLKVNDSAKNIKTLNDENRKLQNNLEQRDKQFKNDRKKLEKEIEKLKDRIQTLTTGKTKELSSIDFSEPVYKSFNGPRATWNLDNNNSKKQLDLYSELVKDYDKKLKELTIENTDLKAFVAKALTDLEKLVNGYEKKQDQSSVESIEDKYQELTQLPFEDSYKNLNKELESKLKMIDFILKNHKNLNHENTTESTINDLNISSINSLNETLNKATISQNLNENSNISLNRNRNLQEKSNLDLINKSLKAFDSKPYIPNSSLSSSSISSTTSNEDSKKDSSNQSSNENLDQEKVKLALEKKFFYEEKLKLEQETLLYRKIAQELEKQKKQFQSDQENYFKSMLYSSFIVNKSNTQSN